MRDAPRHIAPGRHALRRDKFGYVIKGHNIAFQRTRLTVTQAHAHQQAFQLALAGQAHFVLHGRTRAVAQAVKQRRKFGHRNCNGKIMGAFGKIQQPFSRAVGKINMALIIQPNHSGGDVRQHGIKQPPALFGLIAAAFQCGALPL